MEITKDNPEENALIKGTPTHDKDIAIILTPFEIDLLVLTLYYYANAKQDELSSEDINRLQGIYDKIGVQTEYKIH